MLSGVVNERLDDGPGVVLGLKGDAFADAYAKLAPGTPDLRINFGDAPPETIKVILDAHPDAIRDGCMTADHQNHGAHRRRPHRARHTTRPAPIRAAAGKSGSDVAKKIAAQMPKPGQPQFHGHYSMKYPETK